MRIALWPSSCLLGLSIAISACVPVPVSTAALHPREARPFTAESGPAEDSGIYSALAFEPSGALLAAYDSGANRIRVLGGTDLVESHSRTPARWPRRLSFSPEEGVFSMLCWNGVRQHWDSRTWARLDDTAAPTFWSSVLAHSTSVWLAGNGAATVGRWPDRDLAHPGKRVRFPRDVSMARAHASGFR